MKIAPVMMMAALTLAAALVAGQSSQVGDPHGELLYSTYCIGCHTTQMHWREKKLATDWGTLRYQVRRWQENVAPGLAEEDSSAIARYLNNLYYHFPAPDAGQPG
jgi:mono/diheme cytochrome c family protein